MALQDLTPQLRTRLSRVERIVGLFVTFATLLFIAGLTYYLYATAKRKGWGVTKIVYATSLNNAAGLKVGEKVKLMGFDVGEITRVEANDPSADYGVTVFFEVKDPYYGYIWSDSKVKAAAADFLGNRYLEMVKGYEGIATVIEKDHNAEGVLDHKFTQKEINKHLEALLARTPRTGTNSIDTNKLAQAAFNEVKQAAKTKSDLFYIPYTQYKEMSRTNAYWIEPLESPAVTERLEQIVNAVEKALPSFFNLTNQLGGMLASTAGATAKLDAILGEARPIVTNLNNITASIKTSPGSLGEWLIPTNISLQLEQTLQRSQSTLANTDTNVTRIALELDQTLINLAGITSNLNAQVQVNSNILSSISGTVVDSDDLVQGLKRHWLLRSAFKTNKTEKAKSPPPPKAVKRP